MTQRGATPRWGQQCLDVVACVDGRYSVTAEGLRVLGVSSTDEGVYTCRAEVEADGRYDERRIHVAVHGKLFAFVSVVKVRQTFSSLPH